MTLMATDSPVSTLPKPETLKDEQAQKFVLTLSCVERAGIVQAVTTFLFERGFNIEEHQQFDDGLRQTLHLRTAFSGPLSYSPERLEEEFSAIADRFEMKFSFHDQTKKRVLVMVSKFGHCLNDLIFRWRGGSLGGDLVVVASNHETHRAMAEAAGLPFVYIPVTPDTKAEAEQRLLDLVEEYNVDLVVLARYMQVLSDDLCRALEGRAINIHHSFLPGFKGARPYHQAYDRGVKLVGATAHYVTADLDEGPIIEQEVIRVDHSYGPTTLSTVGQDAEALALSRAVRWHCEHRVLLDQTSTVVFR
ncbi:MULTISPECIES: formyltetrahydrofolate deformylase [Micrococcaceae]|jgi:formyltetrahydrofolate deformylase|uniref:Formyltetrahydrofolate deformylase n=1 Tax=Paenarthrobacter aurescens (strain TC1) TaxID=290340 RepID=A1R231_PAEAT|nr:MULTISPECIES: formyltetrahydrofolate deformylase [Micrococcaceae]ABM07986.1 formyltetrahydrofolate deformylase [Paenarthrobacter aurescens TC1]AFR27389.1 formyltetrahydrofolate deformylase PurU [Arthrobacter sp. Rue61a]MBP2267735.1 formyltetrahydrofolate deformylase [Pseudarthrobacter sp. PvP004]